ncbi:TolC family protein [Rouxiella silvae]|uniref:TolC family protein n=1 Tax=Rouxiella silvae TaxID=1646373 RepID=A0AA40X3Q7_9GAMM|nr:TolC family protein [Rouxiella silvae]MBF6638141.1 TolC family protein [Rouxiella silvae]
MSLYFKTRPLSPRLVPIVVMSFFASGSAWASDLSFNTALQAAMNHSSTLIADRSLVSASQAETVMAGQLPDPVLKAGIDNLPADGGHPLSVSDDDMTMQRMGIEQEWVSGEKRSLATAAGERKVNSAHSIYLGNLATLRIQTTSAWLSAYYARLTLESYNQLISQMDSEIAATRASYRGANATSNDVVEVQSQLTQQKIIRLQAQQRYQAALIALSRWTGVDADGVQGSLPPLQSSVASLSLQQLTVRQPELIAASADISLADANTAVANSDRSPNWTWEVDYQNRSAPKTNMISVGVSIPLPVYSSNKQDRAVEANAALGTRARELFLDKQRQIQANIADLSSQLTLGQQRIALLQHGLLPLETQKVQLAEADYRAGNGALSKVFAARREKIEATLSLLALQQEVALSWAQLEYQVLPPALMATSGVPADAK